MYMGTVAGACVPSVAQALRVVRAPPIQVIVISETIISGAGAPSVARVVRAPPTPSQTTGNTVKRFEDFDLKAEARI
jgi:hypothetical protein